MIRGYKTGGYPQKANGDGTTGLILAVVDTDYMPILKAQEEAKGIVGDFSLKSLAIRVDAQAWIELNDGTQIGVHPDDGFFSIDVEIVHKLIFKDAVNFKIAYTY